MRVDSALEILLVAFEHVGRAMEQIHALGVGAREVHTFAVRREQLVPCTRAPVCRLEEREHVRARRIETKGTRVERRGLRRAACALVVEPPRLERELGRRGLVDLDLLERLGVDLREPPEAVLCACEAREQIPRVAIGRFLVEQERVRLHRAGEILEVVLVNLTDTTVDALTRLGVLLDAQARAERTDELRPSHAALEHGLEDLGRRPSMVAALHQGLEHRDRGLVRRVLLEVRTERLDRALRVARLLETVLAESVTHLGRCAHLHLEHALFERDEIVPALDARIEPLETIERDLHRLIEGDLLERVDRGRDVVELALADVGDAHQQSDACLCVGRDLGLAPEYLEQVRVVVRVAVEVIERIERALVFGLSLEHASVVDLRELGVRELVPRDRRDGEQDLELKVAVHHLGRDLGQELHEIALAVRRTRVASELGDEVRERGIGQRRTNGASREIERGRRLAESDVRDLYGATERVELLGRVVGLGCDTERTDELAVHRARLVVRHEHVGREDAPLAVVAREHVFECFDRALVSGREREDFAVRLDRAFDGVHLRAEQLGGTEAELGAPRCVRFLFVLHLVDVEEVVPRRRLRVEPRERLERRGLAAEARGDVGVRRDRVRDVVEPLLVDRADAHAVVTLLALVARDTLARLKGLDELVPCAGALVESFERSERAPVLRIEREALHVRFDRARNVRQLHLEQIGDADEQRLLRLDLVLEADLQAQIARERSVVAGREVDTFERTRRGDDDLGVVGVDLDETFVCALGRREVTLGFIPEDGELEEQLGHEVRRVGRDLDALFEQLRAITLTALLLGEPGERATGFLLGGIGAHGATDGVERGARVAEALFLDLREPQERDHARRGIALFFELHVEHARESGPILERFVDGLEDARDALTLRGRPEQTLECLLGLAVGRALVEHQLECVHGGFGLFETLLVERADLVREIDRVHAFGRVEVLAEQLEQLTVAPHAAVEPVERAARGPVHRLELEHVLVRTDRLLGLVEDLLEEEAHLQQELELLPGVHRLGDALAVQGLELGPALLVRVQLLEREERPLRERVLREHADMERLGLRRRAEHEVVDIGDARRKVGDVALAESTCLDRHREGAREVFMAPRRFGCARKPVP